MHLNSMSGLIRAHHDVLPILMAYKLPEIWIEM